MRICNQIKTEHDTSMKPMYIRQVWKYIIFFKKKNYEYSSNMQIRSFQLIIYIGKSNCSFCWHFFKSYIYRSYLHQILTLNSKYFCNANKIWRWKLLGSPLQLFPHMFHKLFRKTEQMIRICRLSATSQYSFLQKCQIWGFMTIFRETIQFNRP